ncbi:hypothetical protein ASG35_14485 [Burkholderia sp. Leaf177]|nr:hypothetical protein ASG35_14485 [Burkholderia sp. Leaf177]
MVKLVVSRIADTLAIARSYEQTLCHRRKGLVDMDWDRRDADARTKAGQRSGNFASAAAVFREIKNPLPLEKN